MALKALIKLLVPPLLTQGWHGRRNGGSTVYGLRGDYTDWDAAMAASAGYDSDIILARTRAALLKVKDGEAAYERDSVTFQEVQYAWPLLSGLLWVAAQYGGALDVLDFGGSLGTTFFQNRAFLSRLPHVRWNIVEQPRHVEIGKEWFEDDQLKFYLRVEDCLAATQPNVVILSSVLQYLQNPYKDLCELMQSGCNHIIIDRTPFWLGPTDRLCVQHVPENIYPGSYPSWIFSMERFRSHLKEPWRVVAEFDSPDKLIGPIHFSYRGMIITRRDVVEIER